MNEEQSGGSRRRVIKLGGSLLELSQWPGEFRRWLSAQPPRRNVLIVGGGEVVEAVRRWDSIHRLPPADAHWLAIAGMSVTARLAAKLLPDARLTDSWAELLEFMTAPDSEPGVLVFDPARFLESTEPTLPGDALPASWDVTSDSIAVRIATALAARELVLLKSRLPDKAIDSLVRAAEAGYVDRAFLRLAGVLPTVRFVDLSDPRFAEAVLTTASGHGVRRLFMAGAAYDCALDDNGQKMRSDPLKRRNIELKARLRDLASAQAIAERITGGGPDVQRQTDTYFRSRHGRLKLREIDGGLAQLVAYQRPDVAESKGSDYSLVPVVDPRGLKQSLALTLDVLAVVRKTRQIYLHENVRIHLDKVEGVGTFLEFEAVLSTEIDDETGRRQVEDLQRLFAITPGDLLTGSYSDMLVPPER